MEDEGSGAPRPKFVRTGCAATATRSENVGLARRLEAGPGEYAQFARVELHRGL